MSLVIKPGGSGAARGHEREHQGELAGHRLGGSEFGEDVAQWLYV